MIIHRMMIGRTIFRVLRCNTSFGLVPSPSSTTLGFLMTEKVLASHDDATVDKGLVASLEASYIYHLWH
jgi:hypothetical protein